MNIFLGIAMIMPVFVYAIDNNNIKIFLIIIQFLCLLIGICKFWG